jgi:N,N-dimethylformamidase
MRPKHRNWSVPGTSSLWAFNSDLHLIDWLEQRGIDFDVYTDEDVEREGYELLATYPAVMTGTHPEYVSERMLSAFELYQQRGGRFMYMGGNGFYWVTCFHPDNPGIIEVRRGESGTRAWTSNPGEYVNAFDGRFGGLWRQRGRMPSKVCGVTFTAYGFDASGYYRRLDDSYTPECKWIFDGVDEECFGDYGLLGGGAAGLELDRYDIDAGTPRHAYVLATSEGHSDLMMQVNEEIHYHVRGFYEGANRNPLVRADLVYYTTPGGGAVFSTGSIAWCGSLSHNGYDNAVSRITENVVRRFASEDPLP